MRPHGGANLISYILVVLNAFPGALPISMSCLHCCLDPWPILNLLFLWLLNFQSLLCLSLTVSRHTVCQGCLPFCRSQFHVLTISSARKRLFSFMSFCFIFTLHCIFGFTFRNTCPDSWLTAVLSPGSLISSGLRFKKIPRWVNSGMVREWLNLIPSHVDIQFCGHECPSPTVYSWPQFVSQLSLPFH